jgi:hypothetical protein
MLSGAGNPAGALVMQEAALRLGLLAVVIVAIAVSLYVAVARWGARRRGHCPGCGQQALQCVQWIRASVMVEGRRAPDSWHYFSCESCGGQFKKHVRGSLFSMPSRAEWERDH